jgi:uncharacterized peroxidase-related enzyme
MAFIDTVPPGQASGEVAELYRRQQGKLEYLPNYAGVFCHRPPVMQAWAELQATLRQNMDDRSFGLVTLAAALAINSSYCSLAHGRKLMGRYFSADEMKAILRDDPDAPLRAEERSMMRLARKVALDAGSVTAGDIDELREMGCSDARIFDVVAVASARCFFAKIPDALGVQPDAALGDLDQELLSLLVVGRPVEEGAAPPGRS